MIVYSFFFSQREKYQHKLWQKRMEDWRRLKMAGSSSGFAEFMNNEDIINPPGVTQVLGEMYADQAILRAKQVMGEEEEQVFIAESNGMVWMLKNIPTPQITVVQSVKLQKIPMGSVCTIFQIRARRPCIYHIVSQPNIPEMTVMR